MEDDSRRKRPPTLEQQLIALAPKLYAHALSLTHSKEAAEDLVQSTRLRVLETLHQWTGIGRFDRWVARVMDSVWSNDQRWKRRRPEEELPEPELIAVGGFETQVQQGLMIETLRAKSALADEDYDLLIKVYKYDYTYTELAEELGQSRGTILSRVHRARVALRRAASSGDQGEAR